LVTYSYELLGFLTSNNPYDIGADADHESEIPDHPGHPGILLQNFYGVIVKVLQYQLPVFKQHLELHLFVFPSLNFPQYDFSVVLAVSVAT